MQASDLPQGELLRRGYSGHAPDAGTDYKFFSRPPRVLVADDQRTVLEALRLLLKGDGCESELVSGPEGVLETLRRNRFDLALLDLNYTRDTTSGREGLDLLTQIREINPHLPIVVMTAWSSVDLAVEAMRRGACDFIQKPWDNQHVLTVVRTHVQRYRQLCRQRRTWEEEVKDAAEIQRRLLPDELPQPAGCEIAGAYLPARFVGGDYFDVIEVGGHTALCVGDVSGKGMPAALLMANLQAALRPQVLCLAEPAVTCSGLNRSIRDATVEGKFISLFYGLLSPDSSKLLYCNAGHVPPVLLRSDGSYERLASSGAVLGHFSHWPYEQREVCLDSGSRLLLFTDGIIEACNASGEEFGEDGLIELVLAHRGLGARDLKDAILASVIAHSNAALQDDATLLVLAVQ